MLPFVFLASLVGLVPIIAFLTEWFIAYYREAIYEINQQSRLWILWPAISVFLYLSPFLGLIPHMTKRPGCLLVIGFLAALPSLVDGLQIVRHHVAKNFYAIDS